MHGVQQASVTQIIPNLSIGYWTDATPAFLTNVHVLGRTCQLWACWSLIPLAHYTLPEGILRSTDPVFADFLPIASSVRCAGKLWGGRRWQSRFFSAVLLQKAGWSSRAHSTGKRCLQLQLTASGLWLKRRIVFSPYFFAAVCCRSHFVCAF